MSVLIDRGVQLLVVALALLASACGRIAFDPTADASTIGRPPSPCPIDATTILCDDFERPGFTPWTTVNGVARVDSPVRSGGGALHAQIAMPPQVAYVDAQPAVLLTEPRLFIRTWMYIAAGSSLDHINFITLVDTTATKELTLLAYLDGISIWRATSTNEGYDGPALVLERWTCIEVDIVVDDLAGAIEVRIDGVVGIAASSIDTRTDTGYAGIAVGLPYTDFTEQRNASVYYDDFHLGTAPIGCGD